MDDEMNATAADDGTDEIIETESLMTEEEEDPGKRMVREQIDSEPDTIRARRIAAEVAASKVKPKGWPEAPANWLRDVAESDIDSDVADRLLAIGRAVRVFIEGNPGADRAAALKAMREEFRLRRERLGRAPIPILRRYLDGDGSLTGEEVVMVENTVEAIRSGQRDTYEIGDASTRRITPSRLTFLQAVQQAYDYAVSEDEKRKNVTESRRRQADLAADAVRLMVTDGVLAAAIGAYVDVKVELDSALAKGAPAERNPRLRELGAARDFIKTRAERIFDRRFNMAMFDRGAAVALEIPCRGIRTTSRFADGDIVPDAEWDSISESQWQVFYTGKPASRGAIAKALRALVGK